MKSGNPVFTSLSLSKNARQLRETLCSWFPLLNGKSFLFYKNSQSRSKPKPFNITTTQELLDSGYEGVLIIKEGNIFWMVGPGCPINNPLATVSVCQLPAFL